MAIHQEGTPAPPPREYPEGWPHYITDVKVEDGTMRIKTIPV